MNYKLILFIEKCVLNSNLDVCIVYKRFEYIRADGILALSARAKLNITITIVIMIGIDLNVCVYEGNVSLHVIYIQEVC